jgi:L-fucose isomerase-like protein
MLDYKVKIGLVPCRRWIPDKRKGIFNPKYAIKNKNTVYKFIMDCFSYENVEFIDIEWLNEEGLMFDPNHADAIADHFKAENVDGIFIINCNFGSEEAIGRLGRLMQTPLLLWAPQDTIFEDNGMRYTDAQCGIFAASRQLQRLNIPFSYIENCEVNNPILSKGLNQFISVVCMVKNFKKLRVGQVGLRPKPFYSVMINEAELLNKFGIEIIPINLSIVLEKFNRVLREKYDELKIDVDNIKSTYDVGNLEDDAIKRMMVFKYVYLEIEAEYDLSIISTECWTSMPILVDVMPCLSMSYLADKNRIVTCENDIHGAITMALLSCASRGKSVPFFGEFTARHPENPNAELLWHCGPFAYSLKKSSSKPIIFNSKPGFQVKDGHYTIARFERDKDEYSLLVGEFNSVDGPYTFGTYLWGQFDNLSKWEHHLVEGPYIHHMAEIEGNYTEALAEFCKYISGLRVDIP